MKVTTLKILFILGIVIVQSCISKVENKTTIAQTEQVVTQAAAELSEENQKLVTPLVNAFQNKDKKAISKLIRYPFKRAYPIPKVQNETEFLKRFDEIFDEEIITKVANSNIKTDWSEVGWRGIMLLNGDIWLDDSGHLFSMNYISEKEKTIRLAIIETERKTLFERLQRYNEPTIMLATAKFKIRIDFMGQNDENGNDMYRYASWEINEEMSDRPELVVNNGKIIMDGSGGNHRYQFKNGDFTYDCAINLMGSDDTPPANLTVYQKDKVILEQPAEIVESAIYRKIYEAI